MGGRLVDSDPWMDQYLDADEDGVTVRSVFKDTEAVLADNQRARSLVSKPRVYTKGGVCYRHVAEIPQHLIHQWTRENGGVWPDNAFLLRKVRDREFSKLLRTEEKF